MRSPINRRTATKVKDGRVQPKNCNRPTGHDGYVIDRKSAGRGFRHVVSKQDLQAFIEIIPEWPRHSERLERIVLAGPGEDADGHYAFYHREETGAIFLCAWSDELWTEVTIAYFEAHEELLKVLEVSHSRRDDGVTCRFTEAQARAFMLLHVFMHELGHHHDRIHQKHLGSSKGEGYAEGFANKRFQQLFPQYVRIFGSPGRASK